MSNHIGYSEWTEKREKRMVHLNSQKPGKTASGDDGQVPTGQIAGTSTSISRY